MHILIIPSWYKSVNQPVLGSFFEEQARSLIKAGHKVGIIYPSFYPPNVFFEKKDDLIFYTNDNGLPTYSFNIQGYIPRARMYNYRTIGRKTAMVFEEYVTRFGVPDLVHAHSVFYGGIAANYLFEKYKMPFVITEHLTTFITGGVRNEIDREVSAKIFTNAERSIVVSSSFKTDLAQSVNVPESTFTVVHNMVSDLFFENVFEKKFNPDEPFIFLTNSFFNHRKNHNMLFDAVKILLRKNHNVKLKVGGYGDIEKELKDYAKKIGVHNAVEFIGELDRSQVKTEMDNCHAFVLPSRYETFGVVLIESLACGRPIVSTDCGGPRDIVTPFNGLMIQNFEPAILASAMERLMNMYNNFDQQRISRDCFDRFSEEKISGRLIGIYNEALQKRPKGINIDLKKIQHQPAQPQRSILLTFDYELYLGRRSGNISECIIKPTENLLKVLQPYHVKAIFFVDTTYLLTLQKYAEQYQKCADDFNTIRLQIKKIVRSGHYVFPHIHPHWLDAVYLPETNEWNLTNVNRYRFHNISEADREYLFNNSVALINEIAGKVDENYKADGFRAGGWSIQPFEDFKPYFEKNNIRYDFSVLGKSYQFSTAQEFDFSTAPEKLIYHFNENVCVEDENGPFVQLTNSTIRIEKWRELLNKIIMKVNSRIGQGATSMGRGEGQVSQNVPGKKPFSNKGTRIHGADFNYMSVELMSKIYLPVYKNYLNEHNYMHFVSHPKMLTSYNLRHLNDFLEYAYRHFLIETDFRNIVNEFTGKRF